jgi:glycosyltransferase involved in cell wall biosynthesis
MGIGGAERFTLNLAKHFGTKTGGVTVASPKGLFVDELSKNGIKHIGLRNRPDIINIIPLCIELFKIIRENDYNIIHCQHRIFTFILQFTWKKKFILIYTAHNVFNDLFQKIIFPDVAVAVSQSIKLNLLRTININESRIKQINNGVKIAGKKKTVNNIITFGFLGRLIEEKGLFNLLDAVKILSAENIDFRLIIRGKGETDKISEYIILNNLNRIAILAQASNDEEEIYKNIDVLLLPSKMNEGMPLSILEAAAREILVVSTRAGGIEDFIENGKTGILLESIEPKKLAGSIREIIKNFNSYSNLIKSARIKVLSDFSLVQMTAKYEELYSEILSVN